MESRRLTDLRPGEKSEIVSLDGGAGFQSNIRTMGLREGSEVRVVAAEPANGPLVVKTGNTTITIGRGMASKIIVK